MTTVQHDWSSTQGGYVCMIHGERISDAQVAANRPATPVADMDVLIDYVMDQAQPGTG